MKKVLLFGATGSVGMEIAKEATRQGYDLTVVLRNELQREQFKAIAPKYEIANVTMAEALIDICNDFDIIISALGKSVSPSDNSRPSFLDVDLNANANILKEAVKSNVKKFVYVSAFHSEKYLHLEYFKAHYQFAELLKASGLNYSIIKPPAIFSGFLDIIEMAKKGLLINIGKGDKQTNPIYEGDLAKECVEAIKVNNSTIEIGGKMIYTRKQLNEIIQQEICPTKSIKNIPVWLFKFSYPIIKIFSKNMYDKFAFFAEVTEVDTIAPQIGNMNFEDYIKIKNNK